MTKDEVLKKRIEAVAARYERKLGHNGASTGRMNKVLDVIPTGILALDHALGIGGWPLGHIVEVFGPPDIGKSSIIAFNAIREAQKMGKVCGIVALEPGFDPDWAEKNGVDIDRVVIGWPDNGQEAFDLAYDFVMDPDIDMIVFDSIGALLRPSEAEEDGKPSQGGQSALITWGVKRLLMPAWKRQKLVILINQVRDKMSSHLPVLDSPGGWSLKHSCVIRIQLKPGKDRYNVKIEGEDVQIGRTIIAHILRNKLAEGTGKRAVFDNYSAEHEGYPFGIDHVADVINTGARTGIIKRGGKYYNYPRFPGGRVIGKDGVFEALAEDPNLYDMIRNEVLNSINNDPVTVIESSEENATGDS